MLLKARQPCKAEAALQARPTALQAVLFGSWLPSLLRT
jgi:hypothetical protein